jgi:uncharacterized membrane protein
MDTDSKIDAYLAEVRGHLGSANAGDEEEVIREIAAHIQELSAKPGATAESTLAHLGPAQKTAHRYRDALLIEKASRSNSPVLLLHASLRTGVLGVLAFVVGLAGYWIGGSILVFGSLVLLWSAAHYTRNANTAIGSSMFQNFATAVAGAIVLVITTLLLRAFLRSSKRMQPPR